MPRGDKFAYSDDQRRQAEQIERNYLAHGIPEKEARDWAWEAVQKASEQSQNHSGDHGRKNLRLLRRRAHRNKNRKHAA